MMRNKPGGLGTSNGGPRKAALILAGASARGPFAAGALSVIAEQDDFDIRCVVGTSSGALNGAVYAAGLRAGKAQLAAEQLLGLWTRDATWWRILPRRSRKNYVVRPLEEFSREPATQRVTLRMVVTSLEGQRTKTAGHPHTTFEKTYSYSAAQLGDPSWLDEIATVAVASSAIPFLFPPVPIGTGLYADGGLVEDAPIAWALREDSEIDHLLVVTPDPPVAPHVGVGNPLSLARRLLEIIIEERLSRDLHAARSFNEELHRLARLGVDMSAVRKELGWRQLHLIEIRPEDEPAEGGFLSGFFSPRQRKDAIRAGKQWARIALARWRKTIEERSDAAGPATHGAGGATPLVTSKHLRGRSEILLVAPIKPGLVSCEHTVTYASRLKLLLKGLFDLRQAGAERLGLEAAGPLDMIQTLHFVQWAILDGTRLLLAVTFDGPWESYIRNIVDEGGAFLDVIFCHCVGYEEHATSDGYEPFARWVRKHQVEVDYLHAAAPDLSADDVRFLKQFERLYSKVTATEFPSKAAALSILDKDELAVGPPPRDPTVLGQVINAFFALSVLFTDGKERQYFQGATLLELQLLQGQDPTKRPPNVSDAAWQWRTLLAGASSSAPEPVRIDAIHTVQGNILTGYPNMKRGCLVFLQFDDALSGRRFLEHLRSRVTSYSDSLDRQPACNIGLTFDGLQTLDLRESVLADLPEEFREGMEARAPMLGDIGANHPQNWVLPEFNWADPTSKERIALSTIDAVVILQADDIGVELERWIHEEIEGRGARVLGVQALERHEMLPDGTFREHFGFRDGFSQPVANARDFPPVASVPERDRVAVGEILLGYENDRGEPNTKSYGLASMRIVKNGAFLAVRKLKQDVAAFDAFVTEHVAAYPHASSDGRSVEDVFKAKLMGRFTDGEPIVVPSSQPNDFDYSLDPGGGQCPLFAHVRRANPRFIEKKTPRIVRRGFSYGPRYEQSGDRRDRGLVFMAYAASLGQQFEVIQGWVNGANSTGTLSGHADPLTRDQSSEPLDLLHPEVSTDRVLRIKAPSAPITKVEWGLYLFVPSTEGLAALADPAGAASSDVQQTALLRKGQAICAELESRNSSVEWQAVLEDILSVKSQRAAAVWAAIRHDGGVKQTPYGLLVGTAQHVEEVLSDDSAYSVCEYGKRMSGSLGELYLGLDGGAQYAQSSSTPNRFIRDITRGAAYALAIGAAEEFLKAQARAQAPARPTVDMQALADDVIGKLAEVWFGVPERSEGAQPSSGDVSTGSVPQGKSLVIPADFRLASEFIFQPNPSDLLRCQAQARGAIVRENARRGAQARRQALRARNGGNAARPSVARETLMDQLLRESDSDLEVSRAWLGALNGFAAPTGSSFVGVMRQWMDRNLLWRLQQQFWLERQNGAASAAETQHAWLEHQLFKTLRSAPVPDLLYRTLTHNHTFSIQKADGTQERLEVQAPRQVIISLASVAAEQAGEGKPPWILFGGDDRCRRPAAQTGVDPQNRPRHPCPGRELGIGVILGMVAAILRQHDLRAEGPQVLSFAAPSPANGRQSN